MYKRPMHSQLRDRLREPRRFMQVLAGARQTGKTTLVRQVLADLKQPSHYATADEPTLKDRAWLDEQWEVGRRLVADRGGLGVLVLDEVQKIPNWSETVKRLWDEDSARGLALHVVILGSAPLLVQTGLSESLTGRFEIIRVPHWSLREMHEAFGWSLDQYVYYGGYPGSAPLIADAERWRQYVMNSLIETTLSRDILLMRRVDKPALLRQLFQLGCQYSGHVLSYTKMLGQLQDAGNTVMLAHYLELLGGAALLEGLSKYAGQKVRQRGSSPKFQVYNTALISAQQDLTFDEVRGDGEAWGRLVESAIGAWLVNSAKGSRVSVHYWASGANEVDFIPTEGDMNDCDYWASVANEVDFILVKGAKLVAVEVKSVRPRRRPGGMDAFAGEFKVYRKLLVGGDGIPIEDFLTTDLAAWFG